MQQAGEGTIPSLEELDVASETAGSVRKEITELIESRQMDEAEQVLVSEYAEAIQNCADISEKVHQEANEDAERFDTEAVKIREGALVLQLSIFVVLVIATCYYYDKNYQRNRETGGGTGSGCEKYFEWSCERMRFSMNRKTNLDHWQRVSELPVKGLIVSYLI